MENPNEIPYSERLYNNNTGNFKTKAEVEELRREKEEKEFIYAQEIKPKPRKEK